ncbi:Nicotinate dehydrogenase subunit B [Methylobacterium crusticola]|uniref:Nicotinate dehydrogenase subunit B n=1 Tax=Methylobacterium crusticola TaxID=1697972 RepID=A0ABQ4R4I8_9HYPH|nr:cytochrome c [Methylobacterium crusticola]GJD52040.1 Nicotinate dehydrogenase subunit B [Methylobacterium crusticola]
MRLRRTGFGLGIAAGLAACGILACGTLAFAILAWRPALAPGGPAEAALSPERIRAGAHLAALGACASCHTAPGGLPYAGGRPIATPYGTLYGTNITPDPETGLGRWSLAAFARALREGVDREGRHLYPAFPYTHYAGLTDADVAALYAFVMSREPVHQVSPPNALPAWLSWRPVLAGWKLLFFRPRPFAPDPGRDAAWNRGAYLAEALGHCGACHSPRNALSAEVTARAYAGGEADGWWAPPLDGASPAPLPWSEDDLVRYLSDWDPRHGGAAGPMRPVVEAHRAVPADEIRALARYVAGLYGPEPRGARRGPVDREPAGDGPALARGRAIYAGACATCHESGGGAAGGVPYTTASLGHRTTLAAPDPRNLILVLRDGIAPREHAPGPIMPAFGAVLTADQTSDLAAYLRARFSAEGPWPDLPGTVRTLMPAAPAPGARAEARP